MLHLKINAPFAALVLAGAVLVAATGGAVAGSLITGVQIKNESVTGKDVKNGSLKSVDLAAGLGAAGPAGPAGATGATGSPGLSNVALVMAFADVPNGGQGNLQLTCPAGKKLLSATSFWAVWPRTAVKVDYSPDLQTAFAVYSNTSGDSETLTIEGVCATVS